MFIVAAVAMGVLSASCSKLLECASSSPDRTEEITFRACNLKTRAVTETTTENLTSFYGYLKDNAYHSDPADILSYTATKNGSLWTTGKYWPLGGDEFIFWACNRQFELRHDCSPSRPLLIFPSGLPTQDVVFSSALSWENDITYGSTVYLSFYHIFARLGTVTVNTQSGYDISNISASIKCVPESTYYWTDNMGGYDFGSYYGGFSRVDNWDEGEYNDAFGMYILPPPSFSDKALNIGANDFLMIPGEYSLTVSYTLTKGDYTQDFIRSGKVDIQRGCINNITTTAVGGNAAELEMSISVQPWLDNAINASLE